MVQTNHALLIPCTLRPLPSLRGLATTKLLFLRDTAAYPLILPRTDLASLGLEAG